MILLDTNVISELVRPEPDVGVLAWFDSLDAATVETTAITVAELLYGVARLPGGQRRRRFEEAIEATIAEDLDNRVQPFDHSAARHHADLLRARERAGRPMSGADAQIAAICRKLKATLATRNTTDFEDTGVELIDPWRT